MRNNSVTKRRRKIRTGRIKTHQPQSKRCKKISPQIGGVIFTRNRGWDCECSVVSNDKEVKGNEVGEQQKEGVNAKQQQQEVGVGGEDEEAEYDEAGITQPTRKILDGTNKVLKDKYYAVLSSSKRIQIYDVSKGANLPKHLENRDIITEIKTDEKSKAIPVINIENIQDFYEIINRLRSNPVILTISRTHIGGSGNDNQLHVRVNLEPRPQPPAGDSNVPRRRREYVGGKKTTYRRKKHVTRRKINTKRRKVMVGGAVESLNEWNKLTEPEKTKLIDSTDSIDDLKRYETYHNLGGPDKSEEVLEHLISRGKRLTKDEKTVICDCSKNKENDKIQKTPKKKQSTQEA